MKIEDINRPLFDAYEDECYRLAEVIEPQLPNAREDRTFDGREWCEENDIPEGVFSDVINFYIEEADYGISPMFPWVYCD